MQGTALPCKVCSYEWIYTVISKCPRPLGCSERGMHISMDRSSLVLLRQAQAGDGAAVNALFARYLPRLKRWATGRLPGWARDLNETDDMVQEVIVRTASGLDRLDLKNDGALLAYLRQGVMNRIRDEIRRGRRQGARVEIERSEDWGRDDNSPLDDCIGRDAAARYERALARLRPDDRALIIAKLEMNSDYAEMATALGKPSAGAARVAAGRALVQLAREMNREPGR